MARKKKKTKTWYKERDEKAEWTQFDTINFEAWRVHLLQTHAPRIPFNVALKKHIYECIEDGSTGRPQQVWYVKGQRYDVRKSRWCESMVEVCGVVHNKNTGVTFMHGGWMSVPMENCKKYLKPW